MEHSENSENYRKNNLKILKFMNSFFFKKNENRKETIRSNEFEQCHVKKTTQ